MCACLVCCVGLFVSVCSCLCAWLLGCLAACSRVCVFVGVVVWRWCVCGVVVLLSCRCVVWLGRCYVVLLLMYVLVCEFDGDVACLVVCVRS